MFSNFPLNSFTSKPFCTALSEREICRSRCNCKGQKWQVGCSFHRGLGSNCWCLALLLFFLFLFFFLSFSSNLCVSARLAVTECICRLCLCCCTLHVALSVFFCVWTSFNLLRMFYVLSFWTSLRERNKKTRGDTQRPLADITEKKRNEINRNFWLWLVCCCLHPTFYFHRPFTCI